MKSFIRSSITLGLVGGSVMIYSLLNSSLSVLALPLKEIIDKLNQIPVFTIGSNTEILLSVENNKKMFITYLSHQDAQKVVDQMAIDNPARNVEVLTIPFGQVYELLKNKEKSRSPKLPDIFTFIPFKQELISALSILKLENPNATHFSGIPLFYGIIKINEEDTFLSVQDQDGKRSYTPFYFELESLQKLVEKIRREQPQFASAIEIKVTPLGGMIAAFEGNNKKQEDFLKSVVLVPSHESAKKLLEILKQNQQTK